MRASNLPSTASLIRKKEGGGVLSSILPKKGGGGNRRTFKKTAAEVLRVGLKYGVLAAAFPAGEEQGDEASRIDRADPRLKVRRSKLKFHQQ